VTALRGSCLCGAVRFEVTEPFATVSVCHCASCKKLSGGYGTVSGKARTEAIRILAGEDLLRSFQPGEGSSKTFCSNCGSNLFGGGWPEREHAATRSARRSRSALKDALRLELEPVRDLAYAAGAQRYMKSELPYLGVRMPDLRRAWRVVLAAHPIPEPAWALRDYAWHDAREVDRYVRAVGDRMSSLSRREATKHLARLLS
jgi:hypothetical protein